jgi:hypothetical protein
MFPLSRSGKTNTLAAPATGEPGALATATSGTQAASNCNSPSTARWGASRRTSAVAARTLSTRGCSALPFVENDSIATRGSSPTRAACEPAVDTAIEASCATSGSGTTPASP